MMRKFVFGASILTLGLVAASAGAQERQGVGSALSKGAVKADDTVVVAADFVDPGNQTAKAVAESLGISVGEATRRLRAQQRSAVLIERLQSQFPDRFLGLRFQQKPNFRIVALFKGGPPDQSAVANAARVAGLEHPVQSAAAAMSRSDERRVGGVLIAALRAAGKADVEFIIEPEAGAIILGTAEDAALRTLAEDAAGNLVSEIRFDPGVSIIETDASIAGQAYNARAGVRPNCTTGFSVVVTGTSTHGATTAGHCDDNYPAEFNIYLNTVYGQSGSSNLNFQQEWRSNGIDLQWHTLAETDDFIAAYYWNGAYSVPITSTFKAEPQAGYQLCKWGRVTEWDCGTTGPRTYDPNYTGYFYTLDNPSVSMGEPGDSGGPIVIGQQAWGWTHGKFESGDVNVFMSIDQVYAKTPLRLILCASNC